MADERLERVFGELEAAFEGAESHADDLVANDLAAALIQDADTYDRLRSWGGALLVGEVNNVVTLVGEDFVACGDPIASIAPLGRAVLSDPGPQVGLAPPRKVSQSLVVALRPWSRAGYEVTVEFLGRSATGKLEAAARDHVVIRRGSGRVLIPLSEVTRISLCHGD